MNSIYIWKLNDTIQMIKYFGLFLLATSLISCTKEKDYTCQCTFINSDTAVPTINVETFAMRFEREETAVSNCKALNTRYAVFNTTGTCIIK
jgi:hypothetical protein